MSIDLTDQVAIVTGAGGGLGRAHALLLALRGARVIVNDIGTARDGSGQALSAPAEAVAHEIRQAGGKACANAASVTEVDEVAAMMKQALDTWGRIDILVNNAGILRDRTFAKISLEDFRAVVDVHLWGTVNCTKAVWATMQSQRYGRILMTTSSTGLYGNFGQSAYGAAKMAVVGLMNTLHLEGRKYDIRINCLTPSAATRMTEAIFSEDLLAALSPDVVAQGMLALVSPGAPSRMILCTGGGTFAAAHVTLTQGCFLGDEPEIAEAVLDRLQGITSRDNEIVPDSGLYQSQHEVRLRGKLMKKNEEGGGFVKEQRRRQWMQPWALTLDKTIDHAARWHGKTEIVSRTDSGEIERTNYSALRSDARRLTNALLARGIAPGDRIGTLAMNGSDHLATWFGTMGMGAICHTLNPRLSDDQLAYIIGHARDRLIFADVAFAGQIERVRNDCPSLEDIIYLGDSAAGGWREMLSGMSDDCKWGDFDENTPAGLCYTSGTTGRPKGVVYTHRSNYLHTLMIIQPDVFNISARDSVLLVVPMFHANAWGLTFAVAATGAKAVLPGTRLDAASLYELIETECVTMTAGVPTVWQALLRFLRDNKLNFSTLGRAMVGGAACPESLIREFAEFGVQVQHNWGMTETSPLGTTGSPTAEIALLSGEEQLKYRLKQGRAPFGVDIRTVDANTTILPRDGTHAGALQIRGHSIVQHYFGEDNDAVDADGFFDTGDIASIDDQGFIAITDRAKDIIKSGGEWISSSEMEALATAHPSVGIAAAIGVPHDKWGERPLLLVQLRPGAVADPDGIRAVLAEKLVRWSLPDAILFVDEIPLGATGKIDKKALRARYAREWRWPMDAAV